MAQGEKIGLILRMCRRVGMLPPLLGFNHSYRNQKAATRVPRSAGQRISKRELEEELGQQLVHSMLDDQFSHASQALASEDESFLFQLGHFFFVFRHPPVSAIPFGSLSCPVKAFMCLPSIPLPLRISSMIRPHSSLNGRPPALEAILPMDFQPSQLTRNDSEWASTLT